MKTTVNAPIKRLCRAVYDKYTDKLYVMTGAPALFLNGSSVYNDSSLEIYVDNPALDGAGTSGLFQLHYIKSIDYSYELMQLRGYPNILVPKRERAFVEIIRDDLNTIDEGIFYDTLNDYLFSSFRNDEKFREAADHFNVPWEKVQYHIDEALAYEDC